MQYLYAKEQQDYTDLSSGRVFYSLPGHPAFPVRLASEIFQRCVVHRQTIYNVSTPGTLYDPCCGAAYHLSVLGYLHGEQLQEILASDIDEKAVAWAGRNLGLLHADGLNQRIHELSEMYERYGKGSHREALQSALVLNGKLSAFPHPLKTRVFQASAMDRQEISKQIEARSVDIVFSDIPYGLNSQWREVKTRENPVRSMLGALLDFLAPSSIVAIVSDKGQKPAHEHYQRIEHFQVGKRRVTILKPVSD